MGSVMAEAVARERIKQVERGGESSITKIAPKKGYSIRTAQSGKIQKTESYKKVISPYTQRLQKHQAKVLKAMESKDLDEEEYKVLADSLAKITHDVQLLTGGSTENLAQKVLVQFIDVKDDRDTG